MPLKLIPPGARKALATSSAARSVDERMRSLRERETKRLLSGLRSSSSSGSSTVVSLALRRP